ncbi:MAG: hypothetical protein U0176_10535 [Bacteroidia bacterium]
MKKTLTLLVALSAYGWIWAQSLIPNPFTFASCAFGVSPDGWTTCTGSPDCAASRCTVPSGCSGQAVMVFGESCYYTLAAPLVIGQNYTISVAVSTGQLGANSIIAGSHTFNIVGLTSPPSTLPTMAAPAPRRVRPCCSAAQ